MIEFVKSLFHKGPEPIPDFELCDDCGKRRPIVRQGTLLLCGGCSGWEDDDDKDDATFG